mmetsp:Transcript_38112/g.66589  ORF Transcript_38112/g.66589 Transcript_38112/m.66589 type:complete len:305 (+) Transcript_38112:23-937(+)
MDKGGQGQGRWYFVLTLLLVPTVQCYSLLVERGRIFGNTLKAPKLIDERNSIFVGNALGSTKLTTGHTLFSIISRGGGGNPGNQSSYQQATRESKMSVLLRRYVHGLYRIWSFAYDGIIDWIWFFNRKKVIDKLPQQGQLSVIELGVGTGLNLPFYPEGMKISALDFSDSMLKQARKKECKAKVEFICEDASETSFHADTFDHALATYMFRVATDPKKILVEAARIVKPKGTFVLIDQFDQSFVSRRLVSPVMLSLGFGRNHNFSEMIASTSWRIQEEEVFTDQNRIYNLNGKTRLITLVNEKK